MTSLGSAIRQVRRNPLVSVVIILTLGFGIAASTTVFSLVNSVLLQPLPYAESDRLVWLWSVDSERLKQRASHPDFVDWQAQSRTLDLAGHGGLEMVMTGGGDPERLRAELFIGDLFSLLGVRPMLGQASALDLSGESPVVISHRLWRRRFDADPDIVGASITLNGVSYSVAAVMPPGFQFPIRTNEPVEAWVPVAEFNPVLANLRGARLIEVIGRLRPGVTLGQAQAEMDVIAASLSAAYPDTNADIAVQLVPALDEVTGSHPRSLLLLGAAVCVLLLISCINVANLLLSRFAARGQEIAMRSVLGAGRARIARQLLVESTVLALLGGMVGSLLAVSSVRVLGTLLAATVPRAGEASVDGYVLGFATLVSLCAGVAFGLAPAWHAWRLELTPNLRQSSGVVSAGVIGKRLGNSLVISEVALATVLVIAAGMFLHSLWKLGQSDPAFAPDGVLTFEVSWPSGRYPDPSGTFRDLRARLLAIPGVTEASTGMQLPDRGEARIDDTSPFAEVEGQAIPSGERQRVSTLTIQPGYFRALGIPLLGGRDFTEDDRADRPRAVLVNEAFARAYSLGDDPVGRRLRLDSWVLRGESAAEIVGVVADVSHRGLAGDVQPLVYLPMAQWPAWTATMVVRTAGDPLTIVPAVRAAMRSIDPDQPIDNVQTLEQRIAGTLADDRMRALLFGVFSGLAVVLAAIGLFGVLSYATSRQAREIGIRMALGARSSAVFGAVVAHGMKLVLIGMLIGLVAAMTFARVATSLLFEISPTDPAAMVGGVLVLGAVCFSACALPARRAARTAPAGVLSSD